MQITGRYLPLQDLIQVVVDPARFSPDVSIETTYHKIWHVLEFTQTPEEQRLLVEACPGEAAVDRFLKEYPQLATRAIGVLGPAAAQDPDCVFGLVYVATRLRAVQSGITVIGMRGIACAGVGTSVLELPMDGKHKASFLLMP